MSLLDQRYIKNQLYDPKTNFYGATISISLNEKNNFQKSTKNTDLTKLKVVTVILIIDCGLNLTDNIDTVGVC